MHRWTPWWRGSMRNNGIKQWSCVLLAEKWNGFQLSASWPAMIACCWRPFWSLADKQLCRIRANFALVYHDHFFTCTGLRKTNSREQAGWSRPCYFVDFEELTGGYHLSTCARACAFLTLQQDDKNYASAVNVSFLLFSCFAKRRNPEEEEKKIVYT